MLDVGAGDGTLLDALRRLGRDAVGLERESDRPDVVAGEIDDLDGEWAAVVFWHSLEHLRTPESALRGAAALVAPGGVMVIAAPNAASWQAQLFGERWFALDLPRHLIHIPAAALVATLEGVGFGVCYVDLRRFVLLFWLPIWMRRSKERREEAVMEAQKRFAEGRWSTAVSAIVPLAQAMERVAGDWRSRTARCSSGRNTRGGGAWSSGRARSAWAGIRVGRPACTGPP